MWACLVAREAAGNFSISALGECNICADLSYLSPFLLMLSHAVLIETLYGCYYYLLFMAETESEGLINLLKVPDLAGRKTRI